MLFSDVVSAVVSVVARIDVSVLASFVASVILVGLVSFRFVSPRFDQCCLVMLLVPS